MTDKKALWEQHVASSTRRSILFGGIGLGGVALAELIGVKKAWGGEPAPSGAINKGVLRQPHFPPRAKRVLHLMMWGGMSQVDTFDWKPTLAKMHGQELPPSVRGGSKVSTMSNAQTSFPVVGPLAKFRQHGQSGTFMSDFLPHLGAVADELCVINSVWSEHVNHDPAARFLHTGFQLSGRPSAGAWINYALGTDNDDLPSFVAMYSGGQGGVGVDASAWGSGFLPSHHQGVLFGSGEDPVLYVSSPDGLDRERRRRELDVIGRLAKAQYAASGDPEIPSKITQYEMAYRMQESVPRVVDLADEPAHVLDLYGPDVRTPGTYARNCILARRLLERDVKYIQVMHTGWDHHALINRAFPVSARQIDQPTAAVITDLKRRGLLEDTLVLITTEFGRTSFAQGTLDVGTYGRDHHGHCFSYVMAGAGVNAGHTHGATDDFSYNIVRDPVHIHDVQATMLHLLGIDHERLTYHYQGRDFRLTDVAGVVVKPLLA